MLKTNSIIFSIAFLLIGQAGICADESLVDQANKVNASPVQLKPVTDELSGKFTEEQDVEREQLTSLWEAALRNSSDINFVLSKIMPSADREKTVTILMKTLSTFMYTGTGTMNPSLNAFSQLLATAENGTERKVKISEADQILLYKMIRDTADKVVSGYRDYKAANKDLERANQDFKDLKKMVADSKDMDTAKQIEIQYTLRKQQREIEEIGRKIKESREAFSKLVGEPAMEELNHSLDKERLLISSSSKVEKEKKELTFLWESTLRNSPDINFVLSKLMPNADPAKTLTYLLKAPGKTGLALTDPYLESNYPQIVSTAKTPTYALPAQGSKFKFVNGNKDCANDGTYVTQNLSFNAFSQLLGTTANSKDWKAKVSQAEQIMLYNMIRDTATKVVANYYDYNAANTEESKAKARQGLVDLAGEQAVRDFELNRKSSSKTNIGKG